MVKQWIVVLLLVVLALPGTAYAAAENVMLDGWIGGFLAVLSLILAFGAYLWARQRPG